MSPVPAPRRSVAAVVLAAGESRRFGSPKQLALLEGRTLLEHVIDLAYAAGLAPIAAVVPAWLPRPASADDRLLWVPNPEPQRGMSRSLQIGFQALPSETDAAVILLGDQPTVTRAGIQTLLRARSERPVVAGLRDRHPVPPLLIERSLFGLVEQATGDEGLRDLLRAHPEWVHVVDIPAASDVDTAADLRDIGNA
jgi:molybdenum cofactor cytidylyltransferase